ncbi:MAG: glucokinase [Pseudomonadota bacterium]
MQAPTDIRSDARVLAALKNSMFVADIGGTNIRLGVVSLEDPAELHAKVQVECESEAEFATAVREYLFQLGPSGPQVGALAVAGPKTSAGIDITNRPWGLTRQGLAERLGLRQVSLLNDLEAVAYAVGTGAVTALTAIQDVVSDGSNSLVVGVGTGLGLAAVRKEADCCDVVATEGGHSSLAYGDLSAEFYAASTARFGAATGETYLSGPGLIRLYKVLCDTHGTEPLELTPEELVANAESRLDSLEAKTLETFFYLLGVFCSNVALVHGARGGVYLVGGLLVRLAKQLQQGDFVRGFLSVGNMQEYVRCIRVELVVDSHPGLKGAAIGAAAFRARNENSNEV